MDLIKGLLAAPKYFVDTYSNEQEILREKNYRLTDLAETQLGIQRKEVEPEEVAAYYETSERYCTHSSRTMVQEIHSSFQLAVPDEVHRK